MGVTVEAASSYVRPTNKACDDRKLHPMVFVLPHTITRQKWRHHPHPQTQVTVEVVAIECFELSSLREGFIILNTCRDTHQQPTFEKHRCKVSSN